MKGIDKRFEAWVKEKYGEEGDWDEGWCRFDVMRAFRAGYSLKESEVLHKHNKGK